MISEIQLSIQDNFMQYNQTITQISKDDSQKSQTNLFCISATKLFNFEDFCNKELKVKDYALSDAIFFHNDDSVVFVEFKSGANIKPSEVRLKIADSVVLFFKAILEKFGVGAATCDQYELLKKIYIVVYDKAKSAPQRTSAISCHFTNIALRFNLEFYDKCLLQKVHTPSCGNQFKTIMQHYGIQI